MPTVLRYEPNEIYTDAEPPGEASGYLAPSVGTFYIAGSSGTGHASFVWYHDFIVDFHSHEMTFVGTHSAGGIIFWIYEIIDEDVADTFHVFLAQTRADEDEGYRIFYGIHNEIHLWAWDAKTFPGHV